MIIFIHPVPIPDFFALKISFILSSVNILGLYAIWENCASDQALYVRANNLTLISIFIVGLFSFKDLFISLFNNIMVFLRYCTFLLWELKII